MDNLAGKIALVTGASRGIGRAIAVALAGAGADVAVNYRTHAADARDVVSAIRGIGRRAAAIQADVSLAAGAARLAADTGQQLGPIDILVNNAAITRPQAVEDISEKDWDELIDVNLKSCFLMTQAVLPGMRQRKWGRILNITSVAAQTGGLVGPHYAASKAGQAGLTHYYANLLAKEGITVNSIAPALIATDMVTANPRARPDIIPVGRFGQPDEVAEVAVVMVRNGYMTGQTVNVNGGWYMS
jgi:3-oxoacyl-[acyl-carrier protein] reductase